MHRCLFEVLVLAHEVFVESVGVISGVGSEEGFLRHKRLGRYSNLLLCCQVLVSQPRRLPGGEDRKEGLAGSVRPSWGSIRRPVGIHADTSTSLPPGLYVQKKSVSFLSVGGEAG